MFKDWCYLSSEITSQDRLFLRLRHHQHLIRPAYGGARSFLHVAEETRQSLGICLVVEEQLTEYDVRRWRHPVCQFLIRVKTLPSKVVEDEIGDKKFEFPFAVVRRKDIPFLKPYPLREF
jgi:hypothetical protein